MSSKFHRRAEVFVEMIPGAVRRGRIIDMMDDPRGLLLQVALMVDGYPNQSDGQPWLNAEYCTLAQTEEEMYS
jgi:hypothetical protein